MSPAAPTCEWPLPPSPALPIEGLIQAALHAGRDSRPGRRQRKDGWTPNRIQTFLVALATHGKVSDGARAAGINPKNAYALRSRNKGGAFDRAWQAAVALARHRSTQQVRSRVLDGIVVPIIRRGKLWGERHRFDNRHDMAVLRRLDRAVAANPQDELAWLAAERFEDLMDFICAGGDDPAAFLARLPERHASGPVDAQKSYL